MTPGQQQGLFSTLYGINSVLQLSSARSAGKLALKESKIEGRKLNLQNLSREVDRKEALAKAMATANAQSGIKGIAAFEGSPLSVLENLERDVEQDMERDDFMTDLAKTTSKYRGKAQKAGYQSQGYQSLLSSGLNIIEAQ
ncbi:MAG: hypothetical protein GY781_13750 [Gammaproteobacteria bacterium]|nr:hypothetical protein [Gammaproteobacteria bacterium]